MNKICKTLLIVTFVSISHIAIGAGVSSLYTATVDVNDQSLSQRQAGFAQALSKVLIKTTGSREIVTRASLKDTMAHAADYMVGYAYLPLPKPLVSESPVSKPAGALVKILNTEPQIPLSVQFSKMAIDELMRRLDLPIWPADRPQLLVWVVEKTSLGYRFVDTESIPDDLRDSFKRRGLSFQIPLYDLRDQLALKPMEAWALNDQQLTAASKRYGLDHWLVLRYGQTASGSIRGSWYLSGRSDGFAENGAVLNTVQTNSFNEFFSNSVDQVVDRFAAKMAYFADADVDLFRIVVENIGSFVAFSELNLFLNDLEIINDINVRSIEGDTVVLDLATEGESRVLLRALNKERRLSRVTELSSEKQLEPGSQSVIAAVEYFRWQATR